MAEFGVRNRNRDSKKSLECFAYSVGSIAVGIVGLKVAAPGIVGLIPTKLTDRIGLTSYGDGYTASAILAGASLLMGRAFYAHGDGDKTPEANRIGNSRRNTLNIARFLTVTGLVASFIGVGNNIYTAYKAIKDHDKEYIKPLSDASDGVCPYQLSPGQITDGNRMIQQDLDTLGIEGGVFVDGLAGPMTQEAVTEFQIQAGLEQATWNDLTCIALRQQASVAQLTTP